MAASLHYDARRQVPMIAGYRLGNGWYKWMQCCKRSIKDKGESSITRQEVYMTQSTGRSRTRDAETPFILKLPPKLPWTTIRLIMFVQVARDPGSLSVNNAGTLMASQLNRHKQQLRFQFQFQFQLQHHQPTLFAV